MKAVKVLIVLLFITVLVLGAASVWVFMEKRAETLKRIQAENDLSFQRSENKKLNLAYEQLTQAKETLEARLEQEKKTLEEKLTQESAKSEEMGNALDGEKKKRAAAEGELEKTKADYQKLTQELEMLGRQYQDLRQTAGVSGTGAPPAMSAEVELPSIVVQPHRTEPPKVLVLNRDFNFVVIDQGSSEGLAKGQFLALSRDGTPVSKIQAEKVYDGFSACAIIEESKSNPIREGDLVAKL
jgi:cell shape-determining protein MreC